MALLPNNELVAVAWLKSKVAALGSAVATELPADVGSWSDTGFTVVSTTGGSPNIYLPVREPVLTLDFYAVSVNSGRPPWNRASQLGEATYAALVDHGSIPAVLAMPTNYAPARVLTAMARTEPRRIRGDDASYARFSMDMEIWWTT